MDSKNTNSDDIDPPKSHTTGKSQSKHDRENIPREVIVTKPPLRLDPADKHVSESSVRLQTSPRQIQADHPTPSSQTADKHGTVLCTSPHHIKPRRESWESSQDTTADINTDTTHPHELRTYWPSLDRSGPRETVTGNNHYISAIRMAMAWVPSSPFRHPEFEFTLSLQSAHRNAQILEEINYDIPHIWWRHTLPSNQDTLPAIETQPSITTPGSEFRPINLLENILSGHPLWPRVRRMIQNGFHLPLRPLDDRLRAQDVDDALAYGNHKSATRNPLPLLHILEDEVRHGWQLVIPTLLVPKIPGAIVSPMGIVEQSTIDELGQSTMKWRVTHDQSFAFSSGTSVNSRVDEHKLLNCLYGWALKRFLHAIVYYRLKYPTTPLAIAKYDLKAAYRRIHFDWESARRSIVTLKGMTTPDNKDNPIATEADQLALVLLRMTFGGSPHPSVETRQHRSWQHR
jgi:hypothetical protein